MKRFYFLLLLPLLTMFLIPACGDDEMPADPCDGKAPFRANFEIGEVIGDTPFVTDTVVRSYVTFSAEVGYGSYRWFIGTDTTARTQREFTLRFDDAFIGQHFTVTLVATKPFYDNCFPEDDGIDTLSKTFYLACSELWDVCVNGYPDFALGFPYEGKYEGYLSDAPDHRFTVQIVNFGIDPIPNDDIFWYYLRIYNLPEGCGGPAPGYCGGLEVDPSYGTYDVQWGYRGFHASGFNWGSECCTSVKLWGRLAPSDPDQIIIDMLIKDGAKKQFIGSRVE